MKDLLKKIIQILILIALFLIFCSSFSVIITTNKIFITMLSLGLILFILFGYKKGFIKPIYILILASILLFIGVATRIYLINNLEFNISSDFESYFQEALNIFHGNTLDIIKIKFDGYVYIFSSIIGFIMQIFGENVNTVLFFNLACQILTLGILYKIISNYIKKDIAFLISTLWFIFPVTIFANLLVSTESLFVLLFSICVYIFIKIDKKRELNSKNIVLYVLLGIMAAFSNYIRPAMAIFLIAMIIYYILTCPKIKQLVMILVFVGVYILTNFTFSQIVENGIDTKMSSGSFAWSLFYGANYDSCGSWTLEDDAVKKELIKYDNASELLLNKTFARYKTMGITNTFDLMKCKFNSVWQQQLGTFWFVVSESADDTLLLKYSHQYADFGNVSFVIVILFALISVFMELRKSKYEFLFINLYSFGYILSMLLICINGRYSFPFYLLIPIIMIPFVNYLITPKKIKDGAIVTDALWRKSISVIRSLGKKDIPVAVLSESILTTGRWSKYANVSFKTETAANDTENFSSNLLKIIDNYDGKPVIFPMEDATLMWCSENREKLIDKAYLLLPPKESLTIAEDKALTMKFAIENGIPCPKTLFPKNATDLKTMIKTFEGDFVIKPYSGSGSSGILYGSEMNDIDLSEHWKKHGSLILQERIPKDGAGFGMSIIMDNECNVIGHFGHKRLEQYPNSGGPSTQRIGVIDENLYQMSTKLLKALKWTGVAMVEWKYNLNTNEMVLMEINPRFWGSLELAVRSGVDFPNLYYKLAKGEKVKPILKYRDDIVCRWLVPGDILRYLTKKDREKLSKFLKGILKESEEWDKTDIRCFFASFICQGLLVLNPKYWKYIRK